MISPDKKRYSLSLTTATVEEFQSVTRSMGMPPSVMSLICDEAIAKTLEMFKKAQAKGSFTLVDLFNMMGQVIEEAVNEEKNK